MTSKAPTAPVLEDDTVWTDTSYALSGPTTVFPGKNLTIQGTDESPVIVTFSEGASLNLQSGSSLRLQHVKFQGSGGIGIQYLTDGEAYVYLEIDHWTCEGLRQCLLARGTTNHVQITNSHISNSVEGIFGDDNLGAYLGSATVANTTFEKNSVAISMSLSTVILENCVWRDNGIGIEAYLATVTLSKSFLQRNRIAFYASMLYVSTSFEDAAIQVNDCVFEDNGEGILVPDVSNEGSLLATRNLFYWNIIAVHIEKEYITANLEECALLYNDYGVKARGPASVFVADSFYYKNKKGFQVHDNGATRVGIQNVVFSENALGVDLLPPKFPPLEIYSNMTVQASNFLENGVGIQGHVDNLVETNFVNSKDYHIQLVDGESMEAVNLYWGEEPQDVDAKLGDIFKNSTLGLISVDPISTEPFAGSDWQLPTEFFGTSVSLSSRNPTGQPSAAPTQAPTFSSTVTPSPKTQTPTVSLPTPSPSLSPTAKKPTAVPAIDYLPSVELCYQEREESAQCESQLNATFMNWTSCEIQLTHLKEAGCKSSFPQQSNSQTGLECDKNGALKAGLYASVGVNAILLFVIIFLMRRRK